MLDPNMKPLQVTEQAKENFAKAVWKVMISMNESGEAFKRIEANKANKAG